MKPKLLKTKPAKTNWLRRAAKDKRATAAVEMALVAPVFMLVVFGIIEIGLVRHEHMPHARLPGRRDFERHPADRSDTPVWSDRPGQDDARRDGMSHRHRHDTDSDHGRQTLAIDGHAGIGHRQYDSPRIGGQAERPGGPADRLVRGRLGHPREPAWAVLEVDYES